MKLKFRPNVAAILQNSDSRILIGERIQPRNAWQFPQGGVHAGEDHHTALIRELQEELSLSPDQYEILDQKGPYRYVLGGGRTKKGYDGQEQQYFLLRFQGDQSAIDVRTGHQEFRQVRWILPSEFSLDWAPPMKRDVYRAVFLDFFSIDLPLATV